MEKIYRTVLAKDLEMGMKLEVKRFHYEVEVSNLTTDSVKVTAWHIFGKETFHVDEEVEVVVGYKYRRRTQRGAYRGDKPDATNRRWEQ